MLVNPISLIIPFIELSALIWREMEGARGEEKDTKLLRAWCTTHFSRNCLHQDKTYMSSKLNQ